MSGPEPNEIPKQFNVMVEPSLIAEIDRIQKKYKFTTRSKAVRATLWFAVDVFKQCERFGIAKFADVFVRTEEALKESFGQQELPGMQKET